ncbi:2-oxo acid dehydrogenase subunit E2, partial [Staphylococcus epidermidis]|uniref:2-oxo acid dehydrogenase subunit E2 n=1 Tax=Staphylococcus epidermidis TaxID=1282 RepID=UPI0021B39FA8
MFGFFVKGVGEGLKVNGLVSTAWQGDQILIHKHINISIPLPHHHKFYLPLIKNPHQKSIKPIPPQINHLPTKPRLPKLPQSHIQNATFTVNNTPSFPSLSSIPIINHPQPPILQLQSLLNKPLLIDHMIPITNMVNLSISIDDRIVDGVE